MPLIAQLHPGYGSKASVTSRMIFPSDLVRGKFPNKFQKERLEGIVLVLHENRDVRRGSPSINVFVVTHPDLPNKYLYATQRIFRIIEEVPEEDLF